MLDNQGSDAKFHQNEASRRDHPCKVKIGYIHGVREELVLPRIGNVDVTLITKNNDIGQTKRLRRASDEEISGNIRLFRSIYIYNIVFCSALPPGHGATDYQSIEPGTMYFEAEKMCFFVIVSFFGIISRFVPLNVLRILDRSARMLIHCV